MTRAGARENLGAPRALAGESDRRNQPPGRLTRARVLAHRESPPRDFVGDGDEGCIGKLADVAGEKIGLLSGGSQAGSVKGADSDADAPVKVVYERHDPMRWFAWCSTS